MTSKAFLELESTIIETDYMLVEISYLRVELIRRFTYIRANMKN